jgi:hypothetical protein
MEMKILDVQVTLQIKFAQVLVVDMQKLMYYLSP